MSLDKILHAFMNTCRIKNAFGVTSPLPSFQLPRNNRLQHVAIQPNDDLTVHVTRHLDSYSVIGNEKPPRGGLF